MSQNYGAGKPDRVKKSYFISLASVSYTHLDVYKRQALHNAKIERTVVVAGGGEETLTAVSTLLAQ